MIRSIVTQNIVNVPFTVNMYFELERLNHQKLIYILWNVFLHDDGHSGTHLSGIVTSNGCIETGRKKTAPEHVPFQCSRHPPTHPSLDPQLVHKCTTQLKPSLSRLDIAVWGELKLVNISQISEILHSTWELDRCLLDHFSNVKQNISVSELLKTKIPPHAAYLCQSCP